jgi:hypothetical protein
MYINTKSNFVKNGNYKLTIFILSDVARQEYIREKEYSFTVDYGNTNVMIMSGVQPLDSSTVLVYFTLPPKLPLALIFATNYLV